MKVSWNEDLKDFQMLKPYCCDGMKCQCEPLGNIKFTTDFDTHDPILCIVKYNEYGDWDEVLTITHCPFCGKKIILK